MTRIGWGIAPLLVASIFGAVPSPSAAHPHAYVDVLVEVRFDPEGRVTALRETWLFDEFYTTYVTAGGGVRPDGTTDQAKLEVLTHENLKNLAEYDYFTRITQGDEKLKLGKAAEPATELKDGRLHMSFTVPLATPVTVKDQPVVYALFDPTYYVEVLHAKGDKSIRLVHAPKGCTASKADPNPDVNTVMMASSLDRTQSAGDGLGILFAEKVTVQCGQ